MKKIIQASLVTFFTLSTLTPIANASNFTDYSIDESLITSDFYQAVNGEYIADLEIPDDSFAAGGFYSLDEDVTELINNDLAKMVQGEIPLTTADQEEMIEFHQLALDIDRRESEGVEAIQVYFDQIDQVENYEDLNALLIDWYLKGFTSVYDLAIMPNMVNATEYSLVASGPSLILPDKAYYDDILTSSALFGIFRQQTVDILILYGFDEEEAGRLADEAISFDKSLAPTALSAEEASDIQGLYNTVSIDEFLASSSYLDIAGLYQHYWSETGAEEINLINPAFFQQMDQLINEETFNQVKAWLTVYLATSYTDLFTEELREKGSQYNMALTGQLEIVPVDEYAGLMTSSIFSMVLGDYYGKTYFSEESKVEVEAMVEEIITAYQDRLKNNDWLSQETIDQALIKLDSMAVQIAYPENYDDFYSEIKINSDQSLFDNLIAYNELAIQDLIDSYDEPIDRDQWSIPSFMVNAFYNPQTNTIVFPAAILQAPFYSPDQSYSENLGGIGAVIAHEISHAFDTNGALFDHEGNLKDWWTEADYAAFEEKADAFVTFWQDIEYGEGLVNGDLTKTENIADLAGLSVTEEILRENPEADFQAFYTNYARIWAVSYRPEIEAILLQTDVHAPNKLRTNVNVQQLETFYEAFDIQEGDPIYLAPEDRLSIW